MTMTFRQSKHATGVGSAEEGDRLKLVESEVKLTREDIKALLSRTERIEELLVENHLTSGPVAASNSFDEVEVAASTNAKSMRSKRKKKRGKSKSKRRKNKVSNSGNGYLIKIVASLLIFTALLFSLALGWGGIVKGSPSSLRKKKGGQSIIRVKSNTMAMEDSTVQLTPEVREGGRTLLMKSSGPGLHHRSLQADSSPKYYPIWGGIGLCDNNPQPPDGYDKFGFGTMLHDTVEECCKKWFPNQPGNECMLNSLSSSPQVTTVPETGDQTTLPAVSGVFPPPAPSVKTENDSPPPSKATATEGDGPSVHSSSPPPTSSYGPTLTSTDPWTSYDPAIEEPNALTIASSNPTSSSLLSEAPDFSTDMPSSSITSSGTHPTTFPTYLPTISINPTITCEGRNPEQCSCNEWQSDYRGKINTTSSGRVCQRWDAQVPHKHTNLPKDYINDGLGENFCRNPGQHYYRAWCYTTDPDRMREYCDVPHCGDPTAPPTSSAKPTSSSAPTVAPFSCAVHRPCSEGNHYCNFSDDSGAEGICEPCPAKKMTCHKMDHTNYESIADCALRCDDGLMCNRDPQVCGCSNVRQSDYRGSIGRSRNGDECLPWEDDRPAYYDNTNYLKDYPGVGLEKNFCRNFDDATRPWCLLTDMLGGIQVEDGNWGWDYCDIPMCDPCSCEKPVCGEPEALNACTCTGVIAEIADECCPHENEEKKCRCEHLKIACRKSLQVGETDYCDDATDLCCDYDNESCKCNMWEALCHEYPGEMSCDKVPASCCHAVRGGGDHYVEDYVEDFEDSHCECDFYDYAARVLDYENNGATSGACFRALGDVVISTVEQDKATLEGIYGSTNGDHWLDNTGWSKEEVNHCNWFGITCNAEGFVVRIDLTNNNLTGTLDQSHGKYGPPLPIYLELLTLSDNHLSGQFGTNIFFRYRRLLHVDISQNNFNGTVDIMLLPAAKHLNFSHNKFTSIQQYKRFSPAYQGLQSVDLSNNSLKHNASEILRNLPPNIEGLILSNNKLEGTLPNPFPVLQNLRRLAMNNNNMRGSLPDLQRSLPQLRKLDVSHQTFSGSIPAGISNLFDLKELSLAYNNLSQCIPSDIGNLPKIIVLNLAGNELSGSIPTQLGKLEGITEELDLSNNNLSGKIPSELGNFHDALVKISGNANISDLAPLSLCGVRGFDLRNDTVLCPPERNALQEFYNSAKGQEWTESKNWTDEYIHHCSWEHVSCSKSNNAIKLKLRENGLSGKLSKNISDLKLLKELDLSSNDMKGSIPSEIGLLSEITYLRLAYNSFTGTFPVLERLTKLKKLQLHGNRVSGNLTQESSKDLSDFSADCGVPSIFKTPLSCKQCTMCCNSRGDCHRQEKTKIQQIEAPGFDSYLEFSSVFFLCLIGLCIALCMASFIQDKYRTRMLPGGAEHREPGLASDKEYAMDTIGTDSVYQFFLGKNLWGWLFASGVVASQIYMLYMFVKAAEFELSSETSDLVYTWQCLRDNDACRNTTDSTPMGWLVFAILMTAHLLKDAVNGSKMIVLSGKGSGHLLRRMRFFFGGMILSAVSLFTLFVSIIYNIAIATKNTEIVVNSVIILFITDVDELFYSLLKAFNPRWLEREGTPQLQHHRGQRDQVDKRIEETLDMAMTQNVEMQNKLQSVQLEMEELRRKMMRMQERLGLEETPSTQPQDDDVIDSDLA